MLNDSAEALHLTFEMRSLRLSADFDGVLRLCGFSHGGAQCIAVLERSSVRMA
jgi:hypothetical protein